MEILYVVTISMISTHTPHAGRNLRRSSQFRDSAISTHTPHAGRNFKGFVSRTYSRYFNSHAPCGAQLLLFQHTLFGCSRDFNSHAPCGAQPDLSVFQPLLEIDFNSHAPCGAQHSFAEILITVIIFQLTRPMRGATDTDAVKSSYGTISTHTPHAGRNLTTPKI